MQSCILHSSARLDGLSGASWCDFIVYTKKGISVERIPFDAAYWATLKQKLKTY